MENFLLYKNASGEVRVEVMLQDETLWLTQKALSELFQVGIPAIAKHIKNIYESGELQELATISKMETVQKEGGRMVKREVAYYNLDLIIAVGYRVNSMQATQFRIWATQVLKEYIVKGFVMDDERLKNPNKIVGKDYFEEQLARIRDIRSSERRFYQKITDIYAQCSADYSVDEQITKEFFATVQNKLHWAISGQTAAEIIAGRADSTKENMGLTNWNNAPKGSIRKTDIGIAKNYLNKDELDGLNSIVSMYLDYAENQARKGALMYMKDWVDKLDAFLQFNEEAILNHKGQVSHNVALKLAETEFEKYKVIQDKSYNSDFDNVLKKLK
jgi:hypothetical protein